jgi:dipeptidyl aminopeptidase/acylaminoacyl peptidase
VIRHLISCLLCATLASSPALAQTLDAAALRPSIAAEDFVRLPKLRSPAFAPSGERFAAVQEIDGRMNLVVVDPKQRKSTRVTSFTSVDVSTYRWISDKRLVFSVYDAKKGLTEQRGGGLFALNADGSEAKELSPTSADCQARGQICRQTRFFQRIAGQDEDMLVLANDRDLATEDLYRMNTRTGRKTLLTTDNPGKVSEWVVDKALVPRAAWSSDPDKLEETFWYRDSADAKWRKLASFKLFGPNFRPVAFDADGTLMVISNVDSDRYVLHALDLKTGKPGEVLVDHPQADVDGDVVRRLRDGTVLGVRIDADKPKMVWFDDASAKAQGLIDASLPGRFNQLTPLDGGRILVLSSSDRDAGTYYLYDPVKRTLEEMLRPMDWLKPEAMSAVTVVRYKARDGLEVPAYLTLPAGREPKGLPLVAWIHGGPQMRDHWGFDTDTQFLASRGYAVLQPNFRGSTGFGRKHQTAGYRQWGQAMQDDITDGIRHLVAQGIVDPKRVCIGGASYGGYATLMGLVKDPAVYRCGLAIVAVSDLMWMHDLAYSDFQSTKPDTADNFLSLTMGDAKADRAMLEAFSPRRHAAKVEAPVFFAHGADDRRVPIRHAEGMRDGLKAAGKVHEWLVFSGEGHGIQKPEHRLEYYRRMEAFLRRHNPPD